ncbi:MAG: hypothetical protein AB1659_12555, partial [Thermodesulfobacteriota bacterium]
MVGMFSIFKKNRRPEIFLPPLKKHPFSFSLDHLSVGVDNFRFDVRLSPEFCRYSGEIISLLFSKQFQMPILFPVEKPSDWNKNLNELKRLHHEMMMDALHKAKLFSEPQIEILAQIALLKTVREQLRVGFDSMIDTVKKSIHHYDMSDHHELGDTIKTKESLNRVLKSKTLICRNTGIEFFQHLASIRSEELKAVRQSIFGPDTVPIDHYFTTPLIHADNFFEDSMLMNEYQVMFGRREEDADRYDSLVDHLREILRNFIENQSPAAMGIHTGIGGVPVSETGPSSVPDADGLIKNAANFEMLFNYFKTAEKFKNLKKQHAPRQELASVKRRLEGERWILDDFYRYFKKLDLTKRFTALYLMQPLLEEYSPPLHPQQILLYLVNPHTRSGVARKLKQLGKFYNRSFSTDLLNKTGRKLAKISEEEHKAYMCRFITGISRYHCDLRIATELREAMERIRLVSDEKIIHLSRANNTLYEFLLDSEKTREEKPIIRHAVLKADVRGSTEITFQMKQKGLNPASFFSLNFFDPISKLLPDYGASKIFIEGDAVILA